MKKIRLCLIFFLLFFLTSARVLATSGCCSSHDGVNCNKIQANGKVVCNDGWTGSSCAYSEMVKCQGYTPISSANTQKSQNYVYGCTDSTAKNYNYKANRDNGSCLYYIYGCTDRSAINYNPTAEKDDSSCIAPIYGCMDDNALNYNEKANVDDYSCYYRTTVIEITDSTSKKESRKKENINNNLLENSGQNAMLIEMLSLSILGTSGYIFIKKRK